MALSHLGVRIILATFSLPYHAEPINYRYQSV